MNIRTLAKLFAKRPRTVVLAFTMLTVLIGYQASNIFIESDYTSYLPRNDPTLQLWDRINDEFQLGSTIIILINQTGRAYKADDYEVLIEMDEIYKVLYEDLITKGRETGIVENGIRSLSVLIRKENAKDDNLPIEIGGGNDCDCIPFEQKTIDSYMGRLEISSMEGILYTRDFESAVIIIQLENDADYDKVLARTKNAIDNRGVKHANMTVTGTIAMQQAIQKQSTQNMLIIFPIALILISIVLFFFHKSFRGIIIAFLPPAFALALTFGTLGIIAPDLTIISVAIVALLLGLGVDYSIHLMNRFTEEKNIIDPVDRIEKILRSTGKAVLLSMITTIIGFSSLMISSMAPMVKFGFGCALGIFFCFISAIVLVPCICLILKFEKVGRIPKWDKFANFAVKNSSRIIIIASFFALMSVILLPQVTSDVNYLALAPEGIPELDAMYEYSDIYGGGGSFNAFLVETDPYGLENPEVIEGIYNMQKRMRTVGEGVTISVTSIADPLMEYSQLIDRNTLIEYLTNLTKIDEIIYDKIAEEGLVDSEHSKTIILVTIPIGLSMKQLEKIVNELNQIAESWTLPENGRVSRLTGQDAIYVAVNNKLFDEQIRSMILALLLVLAALIIIFNSSLYGFLTMIPVIFVLLWEPGFLVFMNIALSPVTITIASIMIGIGIDYGVHITQRVREELALGKSKVDATKTAIEKTGLSLVEAALTTIFGIASILVLGIQALNEFVIVIIFMTSVSTIAAALLLPVFYRLKIVK